MKRGVSSPLMVIVGLAMLADLATGCSSGSGLAGSPVSRTEASPTTPSSAPSTSRTSPPTTRGGSTTAEPPDLGLAPGPVIATVEEAEALLALTTIDAENPPPELTARIDEVLRALIDGELVDAEFFEAMEQLTPTRALGEAYLICDVESLGPLCVATEPDYLEWVDACQAVGGVLIERLVAERDGWAATGLCLWEDEPDLMAMGSDPSGFD